MTEAANDNLITVASFHIIGKGQPWNGDVNVLTETLKSCLLRFDKSEKRLPTDDELMLLWAAVQRHHRVPEDSIVPKGLRRQ